jgi:hypothetical protein
MSKQPSRREFLGALAALSLYPLEQERPDLILYNGNVFTVNANEPRDFSPSVMTRTSSILLRQA